MKTEYKTLMESYKYLKSLELEAFPAILEVLEFRLVELEKNKKKIKSLKKRIEYLEDKERNKIPVPTKSGTLP